MSEVGPDAGRAAERAARALRALSVAVAVSLLALVPGAVHAQALDRTDIPLKNWGGFALYHDAVYDDLDRLVAAGLADRVILETRPLSRIEAARFVARAIVKIRNDDTGQYNDRRDLEPVLDRLIEEFRVELASLGVRIPDPATPPGFASLVAVDHAQTAAAWTNHEFSLVNSQGRTFKRGINGSFTFDSRAQVGDLLSFYIQPEVLGNEDYGRARLAMGYAKLTLFNIELAVGRESLSWGPGYHNSLILSNNAAPLDQIRLATAEPFRLPWISRVTGPLKIVTFISQLEERRDHPFTKLAGMRLAMAPRPSLELGVSRAVMFGGLHPSLSPSKYPSAIFNPGFGDIRVHPEERTNNLVGIDGTYRLSNADRYLLPARDVVTYLQFYWDDTCGECAPSGVAHFFASNFLPKGDTIGVVAGVHMIGVFGKDWLESRFEYARTSILSFNHDQFQSGYWTRGHVISDFIGTNGTDYFGRLTARATDNLMVGVSVDRALVGRTVEPNLSFDQERTGGGVDVSYRFLKRYSIFAEYLVSDVKNRHFRFGDDGFDHMVRIELTRSFR